MLGPTSIVGEYAVVHVDADLQALVESVLDTQIDHYGVVVKDLRSNTTAAVNPDAVFYAASLFKLPIMVEAFIQRHAGLLAFTDSIVATWDDLIEDLGTFPGDVGDAYEVSQLLEMMITLSDNTSAIMLLRTLGGEVIDETMVSLGLTSTSVVSYDLPTSAGDMAVLLEAIARGQTFGVEASNEMTDLLLQQTWRSRIPRGLPDDVPVGNKTGDWYDAAHDVAIVFAPSGTYILAVLTDGEGSDLKIVELSERVYEYYTSCARS
jgi:beta-lactamase class A